jgi:hypothetical protein
MSIAPPGYPTGEADPGSGNRQADENVQYEFKSVQALRGRASSAKAKWQNQGWEFVSENRGTLRTELNFRRVKPKTLGSHLLSMVATFRRPQPKTRSVLVASCALVLVAGIIGIAVGTQSGGDTPKATAPSAAQDTASTRPPADPTVTDTTVDELVDKLDSGGIKVGDQFRMTAELIGSDYWGIGASGDFFVMLKTKEGADLQVFIDESDANGWHDGTKVEMAVKMVERTINGETADGYFEAESAKTNSGGMTKRADTGQKLFDAVSDYAKTINKSAGATVIDSIDPGSAERVVHVNLNLGFASLSMLEAHATIKTMNGQLVDIAAENGLGRPIVKFYLADEEVAANRYLLDPWDVKFKGMLDA